MRHAAAHQAAHHVAGHQRHPEAAAALRLRLVFRGDARLGWRLLALAFAKLGDAVFAGGILRRSALCLFYRVGVGRGAFGCFARVGGGAVIGVLVQRHRFVAFFTTGEHKDRGNGQRDRRQMACAPAFAERRMINIFCPFHICLPGAVLEKVVKDLNAARELMREVDPYGPNYAKLESLYRNHPLLRNRQKHLNYYAVTALLARVQLYAGNLPDALEAAREIVGEPGSEPVAPFSLTTAAATDERLFDSELLFALEEGKMQDNIDVYFGESVIKNGITNSSTALSISINNRNKLFAQQDPADDDYRLKLWFQETNSATAVMPGNYVNVGCIPLIRLSELYYIAAECSANQGLAYLNTLRAHRGLAAMTEVTDLQAEIAKEYSKEFMCEGQMFYYYKRLGLKRIGVYRTVAIEPEEVYVIPLPDDELDFGLIE